MLITVVEHETNDSNIRHHGMKKGIFLLPTEPIIYLNLVDYLEWHSEEEAVVVEEKAIIDELTENEN